MINLKIKNPLIFVIFSLAFLTGCGNYEKYTQDLLLEKSEEQFSDYVYDQENIQSLDYDTPMAIAENGYYYIVNEILHFYDVQSGVDTPLCSRVDCTHTEIVCDAYIYTTSPFLDVASEVTCNCMDEMIAFYDDKLYMIERTADNVFYLCRYNSSFNNRERLSVLSSVPEEQKIVTDANASLISEGYLYYYTSTYDSEYAQKDYMADYQCNRIKLEKDAVPEVLGEFEYPGDYAMMLGQSQGLSIFLREDNVYFIAYGNIRNYTANNPVQCRFACYDTNTQQFEMMYTYTGEQIFELWGEGTGYTLGFSEGNEVYIDEAGKLYMLSASELAEDVATYPDQIVCIDLESKKGEVIYKTPHDLLGPSFWWDGTYFYFFEDKVMSGQASYLTAIDKSGQKIASMELKYSPSYLEFIAAYKEMYPSDEVFMITAIYGDMELYGADDRYIMIKGAATSKDVFAGMETPNAGTVEDLEIIVSVNIIDREKFLNGENVELQQIYEYVAQAEGS